METNNFPQDWNVSPLRDLTLKFLNGGTPSTANPQYWDGDIPWITGADAENFVTVTARKSVTAKGIRESSTNVVPRSNILLVTRTGVGKVSIAGVDVAISQDLTGLIVNPDLVDAKFLCRQLLRLTPTLKRFAQGTIIEGIERTEVERLQIPIPATVKEQHHIANILDTVDEAIRQTEAFIAKLKQIKAGLLHDLLTCGVDENGELRDPVAHPEQFRESEFGLTPNAWNVISIDSLAPHVKSGVTPTGGSKVYLTDGILFVRSQNVTFEGLLLDDIVYIDEKTHLAMRRSEIFPHDVLLNITGASIGRCCPVPEGFGKANVNQHVCAIRILEPNHEDALLLSNILASPIGQRQVFRLNSGGNRQGLNYEQIRKFLIPWPQSLDERKHIALLIEEQENQLHTEQIYLAKLQQLKQGLMQDLLTGSVRVNEINLDLPEV